MQIWVVHCYRQAVPAWVGGNVTESVSDSWGGRLTPPQASPGLLIKKADFWYNDDSHVGLHVARDDPD